jgi:nucleotide-binding universal stress UspA family protein
MTKRMLVPIDNKEVSDAFITVVAATAQGGGATVRLLNVVPPAETVIDNDGRILAYADQEAARLDAEANDRLWEIAVRLEGVPVEIAVRCGRPADEILDEIDEWGADLVAMSTSSGNLRRVLIGSVSDEVARRAHVPVMLVRSAH